MSPGTPYVDLAIQMLEDPKYKGLVFADISALTQYNRNHSLDTILEKILHSFQTHQWERLSPARNQCRDSDSIACVFRSHHP